MLGVVIAAALMLGLPGPSHALGSVLVSNTGKASSAQTAADSANHAQAFTTGGNSLGYPLASIELDVLTAPGNGTLTVTVRDSDASGNPGNVVHTLTNPANVGTGLQTFTAPAGATLDANTKYWVRTAYSASVGEPVWRTTSSDGEDSGRYPGWSIGNDRLELVSGSWNTALFALKLRVNTVPSTVYVANTGLTTATKLGTVGDDDLAQGFRTGGGAAGFYLGSIQLDLERAPGSGTLTVTLRPEDGSGNPGNTVLYTLINPDNIGTGIHRFELPYGAYLNANTNYYLQFSYGVFGITPQFRLTASHAEDSGAQAGWSIHDSHGYALGNGLWHPQTHPFKFRVRSPNVTPPPPSAPENLTVVPGHGQVAVTWDDPGDITIRTYQYSTDGGVNFNDMNGSSEDSTSFTFENLTYWTEYTLAIRASNLSGEGTAATVTATPTAPAPAAAPANLAATPGVGQVTLSWDDPGNVAITKYQLMRQAVIEIASTDGAGGDRFGYSVAIDGDTAVTGAYQEDETGNNSGSAYVFTRDPGSDAWSQQAKLTASNGANGDNFGDSVAIDGDIVIVGAPNHDGSNGNNSGAAYVFTKPANGWADADEPLKLTASDAAVRDLFGSSLALEGNTAVIGAYEDSHNGVTRAGSAYVFAKDSLGVWGQAAQLTASDAEYEDWFGYSVALDGDTVLIGAKLDTHGAQFFSGSAYVFTKPGTGWADANETVKLTAANTSDRFGHSVALDGDTAMVGAHLNNTEGPSSGSVYIFTRNASGVWSQQAELTASDAANHDSFGSSVSLDGDTAAIGAYGDDDKGDDAGSVYLFSRHSSGWSERAKVTASDGGDDHRLGWSVALDGDFVVAGAYGGIGMASNSGSAYILDIGADWTDISGTGAATTSTQVTGLADGAEYTFGIRAANPTGAGPASRVAISPLWPAPVNLTAEGDSGRVALQWDTGDYRITNYLVQIEATGDAGDPSEMLVSPGSGTTTTAEVTSLTNGIQYTFTVQPAKVSGGETVVTGPAATVTATPLLPAPTNLVAAPDKGRVVLQWDTGGSGITNYLVHSQAVGSSEDPANKVVWPGPGQRTTTDVTSLTDGVEYVLSVRAAEVSGTDTVVTGMGATVTETPTVAVPAAPANLTATPGDGQVEVTWDDPGNITITNYEYSTNGGANFTGITDSDMDTITFTFDDLANGTEYTLAIRAANRSGKSTAATVTVTPLGPAPTNLVAARDSTRVVLQWDTGDPAATNYLIRSEVTGGGSGDPPDKLVAAGSGTRTTAEVTGLTNGTEYTFSVMVAEVSGTDTVVTGMAASVTKTPGLAMPAAPANFMATVGHGQVAVSWDNPGNITISQYQYSTNGGLTFTDIPNSNENTTSFTFSNLTNGTQYRLAIRASNLSGGSPGATVTVTPGWPAPTNLLVGVDSGRVVLQWDTGDPAITDYLVRTVDFWGGDAWDTLVSAGSGTRTTAEVSSLTNGTEYAFLVQAAEVSGGAAEIAGASSGVVTAPTVALPATPTNLIATPGDDQVRVVWDNPNNITIRKYQYSTDGGATFHHMNGSGRNTTSFTFENLTDGQTYPLAIRASNLSGESAPATITATAGWPAPTNLVAAPDSTRIVLQWDWGDPEITHYLIRSEITDGSGEPPPDKLVTAGSGTRKVAAVTSLTNGTEYTFSVMMAEVSGTDTVVTGLAASVVATPTEVVPAAPTNLTANTGDGQVRVTWDNPNNITIRKYQYSTDGGTTFSHMNGSGRNTTSFTFTGLTNGEPYTLGIRASNLSGESAPTTIDVNQPADTTGPRVSNIGKSNNGTADVAITPQAQSFTAGWNTDGYPLGSIELVAVLSSPPSETGPVAVTVRADDGSGNPSGTVLYTLNGPADIVTGVLTFTAPANAHLDPHTRYWVHITSTGLNINTPKWRTTNSNADDSGAYPGWSIGNDRRYRPLIGYGSLGSWTTRSEAIKMRVNTRPSPV